MQHRATQIIPALKVLPYEERLKILARGEMVEVFSWHKQKVLSHFLPSAENRRTSGQIIKVTKV